MFSMVVMFALLAVPGILLGKCGLIQKEGMATLSNILLYIAMPFLVFAQLLRTDPGDLSPAGIILSIVVPTVLILSVLRKKSPVLSYCIAFSNCGFLGIPLAAAVFPRMPAVAVYVSIYNVVNSLLIWTAGTYVMSGDRDSMSLRKALLNPVMAFCVLGVLLCRLRTAERVPILAEYAQTLANLTTPLSMTVMGYELSQSEFVKLFTDKRVYLAALVKLGTTILSVATLPVLFLIFGRLW